MKLRTYFRKIVSVVCALAMTATLIPAASAAEEHVFLEQDFSKCTEGDFKPQTKDLGYAMITAAGTPAAEIRQEGGDKYLAIVAQRPYIRLGSPGEKYTLSMDVRRQAASSGLLEIWVADIVAGGTLRLRVHENGAFGVLTSNDSKNYFVQNGGAYAKGVFNADRTNDANILLEADEWYTITAVVDPVSSTITLSAAEQGKDAFCQSVIPVPECKILEYIQLDGQDFGGTAINVGIDNIKVTSEKAATAGDMSELIFENFESRTAGDRVGGDEKFAVSDTNNGGAGASEARISGGNKYMLMSAYNSDQSASAPRVQFKTREKVSGTFTVEWDYNNVSSGRGQYFETYLRTGGNIRVRVDANGIPRIRVLAAVLVPGVMEDAVSDVALKTNNWYTFKATVSNEKIVLDIYDKDNGNALLDTLEIAQDNSVAPKLFDAYNIWFDLWGKQDIKDLTPAAVAVDNFRITAGAYEGAKNLNIVTPAAVAVSDNETMASAKLKCVSGLEDCPAAAMLDVGKYAWYHKAVDYALTNKLMGGYNFYTFGPYDTLTRAMVAQVLYNKEGQPKISGKHGFDDVASTQWYNNAVTWAVQNNVMGGYNAKQFGPEDNVTVEQIAVILWNYSGNPKFTGTADSVGPHSGWAANALSWAVENGILNNVPYDAVTDAANRAQTAQMLMNYLNK